MGTELVLPDPAERAHQLANKPEIRQGKDNDTDMRFDPASHKQPLPVARAMPRLQRLGAAEPLARKSPW